MSSAIRFVAASKKSPFASLHLQFHVKPGASKAREGIISVNDNVIELCVSAQAREGEANKAVVHVVSKALDMPKSDIWISHGLKSRDKTVVVGRVKANENEALLWIREQLERSIGG
ncbi:hypothetical protein BROUX41_001260 [Berkeleyomyces rouxiae]|uniref:uncharacterized protein n=1 Tax=Berkeleyomyces rouxiae TaxID=2035830 RepID=UPI003B7A598E